MNKILEKNIIELIRECQSDLFVDSDISENSNLIEELGFDSITLMQLIIEIEEKYQITMDDAVFEQIINVKGLANLVEKKIEEKK